MPKVSDLSKIGFMGVSCLGCTIPVVPTAAWGPASLTTGKIQREPTHLIAGRWHRSPKSRLAQFSAGSQIRAGFHLSSFIVSANSRMLSALPPDENNFCTALLIPASGWLTKKSRGHDLLYRDTPSRFLALLHLLRPDLFNPREPLTRQLPRLREVRNSPIPSLSSGRIVLFSVNSGSLYEVRCLGLG